MPTLEELEAEAEAQQRTLLGIYGPTPQDRERVGFPNFSYPGQFPDSPPPAAQTPDRPPPRADSFTAGGPQRTWLPGLTGLGRQALPAPAADVPLSLGMAPPQSLPRQAPAVPPPPPVPIPDPVQPPPRLAMPTQEVHTEPPPLVLDERVNPPTATQNEGLEFSMVDRMRDDPIASLGYGPGVVRWGENILGEDNRPNVLGQYTNPRHPQNLREGVADQIRFQRGMPNLPNIRDPMWQNYGGDPVREGNLEGSPELPGVGVHEFRHRGYNHIARLARAYGIPFQPETVTTRPDYLSERQNIFSDRAGGITGSYQGTTFPPLETRQRQELLRYLQEVARQINARRVEDMHRAGVSWEQTGRTMENR